MAINHIGSDLSIVLDQPLGFVSAAEGFVFLSGLVTGRIDRRIEDPEAGLQRARRRALRAYLWHVVGLVAVWLWVQGWLAAGEGIPYALPRLFHDGAGLNGLFSGIALLYQPGLLDILPMYVCFMLLTPWIMRLHRRGHGLAVWLISGAIWALDQFLLPPQLFERGLVNSGSFHILAWQWLFVSGVLLGAEPPENHAIVRRPPRGLLAAVAVAIVFLGVVRRPELTGWWDSALLTRLTVKTPLACLRLLNFALLAYFLAVVGCARPAWLTLRPLALVGRHALPVFTISVWCAQIALSYDEVGNCATGRWLKTAFVLLAIGLTTLAFETYRRRQQQRRNPKPPASGGFTSPSYPQPRRPALGVSPAPAAALPL